MNRVLILFDVDGTLLVTGGAGSRCIRRACRQVFGDSYTEGKLTVGTLDPQLFMEMARQANFPDAEAALSRYQSIYLNELEAELVRSRADVALMPGVPAVLEHLAARDDVVAGLLTGNWRRSVELKLHAAGLSIDRFAVGAFAEDGQVRADLVPAACEAYRRVYGHEIARERVILVGDTPRDIECARVAGCGVVAVSTGYYSLSELQALAPDVAVPDLADLRPLNRLIAEVQGKNLRV